MKTLTAACVLRAPSIVGESPDWHAEERRLYWIDIRRQLVNRFDPRTAANEQFAVDDIVTSLNFRRAGGLILTLRKAFAFFDPSTGRLDRLSDPEPDLPGNRFNDSECDPPGRLWAGTMSERDWDSPSGSLYRLDAALRSARMRCDVVCSNGTGWSPDGRTMYHTESFRYAVFAYDFDGATGEIVNRRPFIQLDPAGGEFPDGLTVDAEGCVWSAHVGKGRIVRYDPDGGAERQIQLPVTRGTSCTFGGDDLRTLYITSARETLTAAMLRHEPLAGSLFACEAGVAGRPTHRFGG